MFQSIKSNVLKLKEAFVKKSALLGNRISSLFSNGLTDHSLEELEQILYQADLGTKTVTALLESIKQWYRENPTLSSQDLTKKLAESIAEQLRASTPFAPITTSPLVILVVGINGNGKTTTVAKLAKQFKDSGKKVLLAAADTFRAGAIEQLTHWADTIGIEIIKGNFKIDPSAIVFDALQAAVARNMDVVIIDTAGRLHTKIPLMQELEKIKRTCQKVIPGSPHETLLVLDATGGQNGVDQAKVFNQFTPLTGLILTKLDGTAKGGVAVNIQQSLSIPIRFIGLGEKIEDFQVFNPEEFAQALFS